MRRVSCVHVAAETMKDTAFLSYAKVERKFSSTFMKNIDGFTSISPFTSHNGLTALHPGLCEIVKTPHLATTSSSDNGSTL